MCRMRRVISVVWVTMVLALAFNSASPRATPRPKQDGSTDAADAQRCEALLFQDFGSLPDAPTRITSARLVTVPPADPKLPPTASASLLAASPIKQYCQVLGYVAPQNKFELRLPPPAQFDVMIASRIVNGVAERSRPTYPYPLLARYSGTGDPRDAASFIAYDPTER